MSKDLQDLIEFNQKIEESQENQKKKERSMFAIGDLTNPTQTSVSNQVNIAEKIKQQKEAEEAKRRAIEKFLPKKAKKLDLNKFLKRELDYEQKRKYNIEKMRFEIKNKERSEFTDKPEINKKSDDIAKNSGNKPLYLRTEEELKKMENGLEKIKEKYNLEDDNEITNSYMNERLFTNGLRCSDKDKGGKFNYTKGNNSLTNSDGKNKTKNNSIPIEEKAKTENDLRFEEWYKNVDDWVKKMLIVKYGPDYKEKLGKKEETEETERIKFDILKRNEIEEKRKREMEEMKGIEKIHPSTGSIKIFQTLRTEGRINENTIERLYTANEDKKYNKELLTIQNTPSFAPKINKIAKYSKVLPKYYPDLSSHNLATTEMIHKNREQKKKNKAKSVDRRKKDDGPIDIMSVGHTRKVEAVDHWSTSLAKMEKKQKPNSEMLYKLNIQHGAAWNNEDVNTVPVKGEARNIIQAFI